ncbi:PLP-dependent aminotransferase family protein [Clostridiaceae bacterium UIB06]|uniref:PLP-dependent aminotransferase family protein n=1 Tax=Clostridium thailandense TaxID=2794346 RepID=A0A949WQB6_9CLOT|nr:PLP-dependent aminotransferase family protein [Clostridium thailandense]MBV7272525.1 PLP-dependent aminotransferase family protein [Clostridium thailandense]MCH5138073.1 PLP-dependent aminotransferase family protein [Clostridiaceae bacterium UIB06]
MRISIEKNSTIPIYIQIKNQIREMIYKGVMTKDFLLPPERKLAKTLGVSRSTVVKAYEELKALGLVESHMGKGTRVIIQSCSEGSKKERKVIPLSWYQFFGSNIAILNEHTIMDIMNALGCRNVISFAAGIADPELYPVDNITKIQDKLWKMSGKDMLIHSPIEGYYPFRESISELLRAKDIMVAPKEVMILSGSQQGIDFSARAFISPGDVVIVEEPTFMGAIQLFKLSGAKVVGVPMDEEGMQLDILEILLNKYKPKFIYTLPTFQNPSGTVMSLKRRYGLLELSYKYQVPIIEDDPYGEIRYEGVPIPTLKALDKHNYVIYLSTFSKAMFSGMRIGWVAASTQVIKKFSMIKQMTDLHANAPAQYLLDSFLREGFYESHIKLICKNYSKKRDVMIKALKKDENQCIKFNIPEGGYYIWGKLPKGISQRELFEKASSKGVIYAPGNVFYPEENDGEGYIRLNFTFESIKNINEGISKLVEAVKETIEKSAYSFEDAECFKMPIV